MTFEAKKKWLYVNWSPLVNTQTHTQGMSSGDPGIYGKRVDASSGHDWLLWPGQGHRAETFWVTKHVTDPSVKPDQVHCCN